MVLKLLEWLEKYGIEGIIILVLAGGIYALWEAYIKYIFKKKYSKYSQSGESAEKIKAEDLEELERRKMILQAQEFFPNIQFKINVDIPSEEFSPDPTVKCVCKNIMLILFEQYNTYMQNFVKDMDVQWNKNEWATELNNMNYKIIEDFKSKAAQQEIPKEVVKEFVIWYSPYMKQIYFYVRKIAAMNNRSSVENTNTYLLLLELILMNTFSDIKNFCVLISDFKGLEYKGKVIGDTE